MGRVSRRTVSTVGAVLGAGLFIYAVRRAGVSAIAASIRGVGAGLLLIIALGGLRLAIRAQCWRLCMPGSNGVGFGRAFVAFLAGDAVGSITPLGLLASEPTKVLLTRHQLATTESVASLTLENLVYAISVVAMIITGVSLLLMTTSLPAGIRRGADVGMAVAVVCVLGLLYALRRRSASASAGTEPLTRLAQVVSRVREFAATQPSRLFQAFLLDLVYHAVAVAEVFVSLEWLMGSRRPTVVMAIIFATLNRLTTVLFKFVPFRVGVDEALNGTLAPLIAVDPVSAVALAVVQKVRGLFWAAVGLVAVVLHPRTR